MATWGSPAQSRERFSSSDKATEHARQNVQERCQVGLQQNLVNFFECLIICTGAALHTHTCCIYFSVRSYKYLQVRHRGDTRAEA